MCGVNGTNKRKLTDANLADANDEGSGWNHEAIDTDSPRTRPLN